MTTSSARSVRPGSVVRTVRRHRSGRSATVQDMVAAEMPVAFNYNGVPFAVMMATPEDLEDFALGFSLSEGIVNHPQDLRVIAVETFLEGASLQIEIPPERAAALDQRRRNLDGRSGCGVCGNESIEAVLRVPPVLQSSLQIDVDALARALDALHAQQPIAAQTGAVHAAGWADAQGVVRYVREDVGRHNALDKLIGALARDRIDAAQGFAVVTSRASYEMAMKAAQARIPLLAAISAPTALAISLADSAGLTLIGFARDHDCVVYSHPQRLDLGVGVGEPA
ncbi:formate dehydrogenase accessory sulfurtransferase FdhD [Xanthomonas hortorum]|uniref:Sulfur carrier protein FdhD n=1 Tax=Xanthomonas hortorum pv. carotae TaxID=487904 RepID=A0A6V7DC69_9XANT|nr:formate dehydrogenase accessory sulfurtransferase FdhD [Xanthomonas hortorum]ETC87812.1 formate dehydrogenase b chain [Xanthomonas hortorum pv. carotae str. M081]CAD0331056.1 Sulfur carrier protein FdhD [Xanthomonas hortorum pv. carotae]CAD0331068.1 Sulfur carrier protein FdhD [Xanthomonas hortorum pv. carotae]